MADVTKITFSGNFRNIAFVILLAFVLMTFVFFMDLIGTFLLLQIKSRQLSLINRIQEKLYELTPIHAAIAVDVKVLKQLTQAKNQIIKVIGDVAKHDLIKIHKHNIFVINENAQHDTHPLTHSKSRFLRQRQFGLLLNHTSTIAGDSSMVTWCMFVDWCPSSAYSTLLTSLAFSRVYFKICS